MIFSSIFFLFYFLPIFLIVYELLPHKYRNYWALAASLLFYTWGAPKFVFIVVGVIILDFFLVNRIYKSDNNRLRRQLLSLSVILKVGLLGYFKYANFFVDNVDQLIQELGFSELTWTKVALPIGISFFTFQALTYSVDVYRKVHAPLKSVSDYLLYILLFPQLIAGPIVRFNEIADQLEDRKSTDNFDNKVLGLFRFIIGLSKKVLIANVLGAETDKIFALSEQELYSNMAWIGIFAYTFQIYFDFSGYSDMAIGLGKMMGFSFPENFDNPYVSQNITEFWRRWHMTLGRFMKDYLYIPLGGNQVSIKKMYFNLALVFIVSGFWHGAAWNFIIWGAFHGFFLIMDRLFLINFYHKIGKFPSIIITFFITMIGWVIFRATSFDQIQFYIKALFSFNSQDYFIDKEFILILGLAIIFSFFTLFKKGLKIQEFIFFKKQYSNKQYMMLSALLLILFFLSVISIIASGFNPFIYFRF